MVGVLSGLKILNIDNQIRSNKKGDFTKSPFSIKIILISSQ